jgi:hypothetical protein
MPPVKKFKKGSDKAYEMAEKELARMMESGKVTPNNLFKIKEQIAKKYGAYPMGGTR